MIQETGTKVRFGLMEYKGDDGGQIMVPFGSQQYKQLNSTTLTTHANNTVAMLNAIETLITMAILLWRKRCTKRYDVAQLNSSLYAGSYVYPLAFSPGVNLGATGAGSLGPGELSALTGSEGCNLPVAKGYITNACGRDPYFFGSNHTPALGQPLHSDLVL